MAGPPKRERFNAKARQSSVGGSSHKKRRRVKVGAGEDQGVDETVIDPEERRAKAEEDQKRRALLAQGPAPEAASAPISSKKRKRLDAYIARQLRKEEHKELLANLAKTSAEVGDRSALLSASTLGTGKVLSGRERIERDQAGTERTTQRRKGGFKVRDLSDDEDADLDEEPEDKVSGHDEQVEGNSQEQDEREARIAAARALFAQAGPSTDSKGDQAIGSALALGPDGKPIAATMKIRKKKKQNKRRKMPGSGTAWGRATTRQADDDHEESSDFDSSASSDEGETDYDEGGSSVENVGNKSTRGNSSEEADLALDDLDSPFKPSTGKGKGKGKEIEGDVAMEGQEGSDDFDDSSASSLGDSDEEDDGSEETDEDEQAILMEAMRLRGMLGDPNKTPPRFDDEEGRPVDDAQEGDGELELPFFAFESEEDADYGSGLDDGGHTSVKGGHIAEDKEAADMVDDEEEEDEEDGEGDDDEDVEDDDEEDDDEGDDGEGESSEDDEALMNPLASRRRGLGQTNLSSGFKDWANAALGLDAKHSEGDQDGVYRGPEPVAGLKQKVSELGPQDGVVRGPLGADAPKMSERSAFAQKFYEEAGKEMKRKRTVTVERSEELQDARLKLPVLAEEERIMTTILENEVTVLCGETGSGKTTQVPQFLFEAGFGSPGTSNPGMVGVTQPRRVAALSMAQRVASELSLPSTRVSHQIRYDATVSPSTSVKFMTDGVLLRELAANFLLEKYSAIIIDEAHERSVNTDVLIGVLSRVVKLRAKRWIEGESGAKPLRLIIMSATLRVDDFVRNSTLFDTPPPVINVEARQHSVTVHFNRRTTHDYIAEAVKKVTKIHARLPPGGVLVFMTGQQEITTVCRRLEKRFGRKAIEQRRRDRERIALAGAPAMRQHDDEEGESLRSDDRVALAAKDGDVEAEEIDLGVADQELAADVDGEEKDLSDADDDALDSDDEEGGEAHDADMPDELKDDSDVPMHILPLYSLLSSDRQMRVFQPPPAGTRLVVVATNVAETSLTIPGISYVVDCGRSKERRCDPSTGVQSFEVSWISKASANQRSGRAGRTGPGHCYRLYSSAVYEDHFDSFSQPEILRTPVDGLVLQMKAMNIDQVAHFPFPTPPDRAALQKAERMLIRLGALEMQGLMSGKGSQSRITQLGRAMSLFPLGPRLSKLLVQGNQHGCLPFIVALVAALTVGDPFVQEQSLVEHDGEDEEEDEDGAKISAMDEDLPPELEHIKSEKVRRAEAGKSRRSAYFKALARFGSMSEGASDPLRLLSVVGAYEHDGATQAFCHAHFLMPKAMEEIHKLRGQVASIVMANAGPEEAPKLAAQLGNPKFAAPPTTKQLTVLRQLLCAAYVDQVAIRADLAPESASRVASLQDASDPLARQFDRQMRQGAKMTSTRGVAYLAIGVPGQACYLHQTSVLFHQKPPEWVIFTELHRARSKNEGRQGSIWLKGLTRINPAWLSGLGRSLCSFSKPIELNDGPSTMSKLVAAARALKGGSVQDKTTAAPTERTVMLVPSYGTGPACEADERASHVGWSLPPVEAKQRLVQGRWVADLA